MFTFPKISFLSISPIILLSEETFLLSPKTKYLSSGIVLQLQMLLRVKSSVSKLYLFSTSFPFIYSVLFLYSTVSPGKPITLLIISL